MQMSYLNTLKDIKPFLNKRRTLVRFFPSVLFGFWISSFVAAFFALKKVRPNTISVLMIPSAIAGSILFSLPFLWAKILGLALFQIWFMLDLVDGQVARFTSIFSKYGRELDYVIHHICHIFFIISFAVTFYEINYSFPFTDNQVGKLLVVFITFSFMIFLEYGYRNICSMESLMLSKDDNIFSKNKRFHPLSFQSKKTNIFFCYSIKIIRYGALISYNTCNCIDNFVMIGSFFAIFDYLFHTYILCFYTAIFLLFSFVHFAKRTGEILAITYRS